MSTRTTTKPKVWRAPEITEELRNAQIGDAFVDLNHLSALRFRAIGRNHGVDLEITNEGNILNADVKYVATVKGFQKEY
jgi:hypothetical protein